MAELNPFVGIQAAVTRLDKNQRFPEGWHPEEKISIFEAIEGYTLKGAEAARLSSRLGSIREGMKADLTVLDRGITTLSPIRITEVKAFMTIIGGKIVYADCKISPGVHDP